MSCNGNSELQGGCKQQWVRLADLSMEGTRNGLYKPKEFHGSGAKIVNMGELFAFPRLANEDMKRIEVTQDELDRFGLQKGDLLFARRSLVADGAGKCSIVVRCDAPTVFESSIIRFRPNPDWVEPGYLFYLFRSSVGDKLLDTIRKRDAVSGITGKDLAALEVPLPAKEVQRSVCNLLIALDNRIDYNSALAANLEAIARRLYKSWFVDFDPVRAKTAGEKPAGLADDLVALFPDRFVDSELGEIPDGWSCRKVSDLCEAIFSGGTPHTKTPEYWGGELPWLSSGETRSRFVVGTEKTITDAGVKNSSTRLARAGDIVIASAGQGSTRGQTSLLAIDTYINQSVVALRAATDSFSSALLFLDLSSRYDEMRAISDSHSSRGSLTTKLLGGMKSIAPPSPVVIAFERLISPIIERIVVAERETLRLGTIRDLLLPRLISGKLRIADAESLIEEAIA